MSESPTIEMLSPFGLWQDGRELLKVSTVYNADRVTAEVVYPIPKRTTVRTYTAEGVATWRTPSDAMLRRYERAWGLANA